MAGRAGRTRKKPYREMRHFFKGFRYLKIRENPYIKYLIFINKYNLSIIVYPKINSNR
jgi:hypothetical protein